MQTSASVEIKPQDPFCRYWAKIVRAGEQLLLPREVAGGNDLPGPYLQQGDEELFPGDFLFEGEAVDRKWPRGWTYCLTVAGASGAVVLAYSSAVKAKLKQLGLDPRFLPGSGDLAGLVRVAHGLRAGLCPYEPDVQQELAALVSAVILTATLPEAAERARVRL